jgi:hypothetical protein
MMVAKTVWRVKVVEYRPSSMSANEMFISYEKTLGRVFVEDRFMWFWVETHDSKCRAKVRVSPSIFQPRYIDMREVPSKMLTYHRMFVFYIIN